MAAVQRLFFGLTPSATVVARIEEAVAHFREMDSQFRRIPGANYHITLSFIGETDRTGRLEESLQAATASAVRAGPVSGRFYGLATFGVRSARVLYVPFIEPDGLDAIVEIVSGCVRSAGIGPATGRFVPHLTVGRSRSRHGARIETGFREAMKRVILDVPERFDSVDLYESKLSSAGPRYRVIDGLSLI